MWENNPGRQLELLLRDTGGEEHPPSCSTGSPWARKERKHVAKGFTDARLGGKNRCCSSPAAFYSCPSGGVGIKVLGHWAKMKKDASHHRLRCAHTPVNISSLMYDGDIRSKIQSDNLHEIRSRHLTTLLMGKILSFEGNQ